MIRRTYACNKCSKQWTMLHDNSDEWCQRCPHCGARANWSPQPLRIKTNRSRAVDLTQSVLETEYGMTNFKDNTREGETVAMDLRPQHTAEKDAMIRQTVEATREMANAMTGTISPQMQAALKEFNGQTPPAAPPSNQPAGQVIPLNPAVMAQAKQATAETRAQLGDTPMGMLHRGVKTQGDPIKNAPMMARHRY